MHGLMSIKKNISLFSGDMSLSSPLRENYKFGDI
jgi:hypothetical protein